MAGRNIVWCISVSSQPHSKIVTSSGSWRKELAMVWRVNEKSCYFRFLKTFLLSAEKGHWITFHYFCAVQVDKIIDQLQQFVQSFDLAGLKEYWLYLDKRLFSRLEDVYRSTVNKLRISLYRYYIINTVQVSPHGEIRHPAACFWNKDLKIYLVLPERKPGEDSGVFPEAGVRAAGSGWVAWLVHPAIYLLPWAELRLLSVLLPPVVWHLPGFTA